MPTISFSISSANIPRVVSAIKERYPVPLDDDGVPLFTDNAWAKEALRRFIIRIVRDHEGKAADVAVDSDNTLAT